MTATVLSHRSRQCLLCSCESSEVKDHLRRLIGEVPTILRYMDAVLRQEREVLCLFACKGKHFLSMKPTFLATKVRVFQIQSSEVENLRTFFPFFPCFSAEPPFFERPPPPFRSVPLPSFPFCSPVSLTRPARSRL